MPHSAAWEYNQQKESNPGAKRSQSSKAPRNGKSGGEKKETQFQPFTSEVNVKEPWVASTPSTKMPARGKEDKSENAKEQGTLEEPLDLEMQGHIDALLGSSNIPEEVKNAIIKAKSQKPLTHSDLHKLQRLKGQVAKGRTAVKDLDQRWKKFVRLSKENWEAQKKQYLQDRSEAMTGLTESRTKLQELQKLVSEKAAIPDAEKEEEEVPEGSELENEITAPWEEEPEVDEMEEISSEEEVSKEPTSMLPFGRPSKLRRKTAAKKR